MSGEQKSKISPLTVMTRAYARAEGCGVKERSSRTSFLKICAVMDGAQRLEGRWISKKIAEPDLLS